MPNPEYGPVIVSIQLKYALFEVWPELCLAFQTAKNTKDPSRNWVFGSSLARLLSDQRHRFTLYEKDLSRAF